MQDSRECDLTIKQAQKHQPWTVPYSGGVVSASGVVPHILATHNVLHAAKSIGKIAAVFESLDHSGNNAPSFEQLETIKAMAADLMTAALRFANLYQFDLAKELQKRVKEKNGIGFGGNRDD